MASLSIIEIASIVELIIQYTDPGNALVVPTWSERDRYAADQELYSPSDHRRAASESAASNVNPGSLSQVAVMVSETLCIKKSYVALA